MLQNVSFLYQSTFSALIIHTPDIATDDINNILSRLNRSLYITQEVSWGAGQPVTPAEYTQNGWSEQLSIVFSS